MIGAVLGVLLGGVITFLVSWWFYVRAASELRQEADRLRDQVDIILRGLEDAELFKLNRDPATGKITGIRFEGKLSGSLRPTGSLTLRKIRGSEPKGNGEQGDDDSVR